MFNDNLVILQKQQSKDQTLFGDSNNMQLAAQQNPESLQMCHSSTNIQPQINQESTSQSSSQFINSPSNVEVKEEFEKETVQIINEKVSDQNSNSLDDQNSCKIENTEENDDCSCSDCSESELDDGDNDAVNLNKDLGTSGTAAVDDNLAFDQDINDWNISLGMPEESPLSGYPENVTQTLTVQKIKSQNFNSTNGSVLASEFKQPKPNQHLNPSHKSISMNPIRKYSNTTVYPSVLCKLSLKHG